MSGESKAFSINNERIYEKVDSFFYFESYLCGVSDAFKWKRCDPQVVTRVRTVLTALFQVVTQHSQAETAYSPVNA